MRNRAIEVVEVIPKNPEVLESPEELLKLLLLNPHPVLIKSESECETQALITPKYLR